MKCLINLDLHEDVFRMTVCPNGLKTFGYSVPRWCRLRIDVTIVGQTQVRQQSILTCLDLPYHYGTADIPGSAQPL